MKLEMKTKYNKGFRLTSLGHYGGLPVSARTVDADNRKEFTAEAGDADKRTK